MGITTPLLGQWCQGTTANGNLTSSMLFQSTNESHFSAFGFPSLSMTTTGNSLQNITLKEESKKLRIMGRKHQAPQKLDHETTKGDCVGVKNETCCALGFFFRYSFPITMCLFCFSTNFTSSLRSERKVAPLTFDICMTTMLCLMDSIMDCNDIAKNGAWTYGFEFGLFVRLDWNSLEQPKLRSSGCGVVPKVCQCFLLLCAVASANKTAF